MVKKAIVFDVSGTLLRRCRAVKNMKTKNIFEKPSSLELVDNIDEGILVVLQTDTKKCVMLAPPNQKLHDFIKKNNISLDISYSSNNVDVEDILSRIKNDDTTLADFHETARYLNKTNKFIELCSGSAFILNLINNKVEYVITAGGKIFPHVNTVIETLKSRDIEVFIASGDGYKSICEVGEIINIPLNNIFETANTEKKAEIIDELQNSYDEVMMVGNGPNDILAFKKSDLAVLTLEQNEKIPKIVYDSVDMVIDHISEILNIDF